MLSREAADSLAYLKNEHIMTELFVRWQHLLSQGDIDSNVVHSFLLRVVILPTPLSCNKVGR